METWMFPNSNVFCNNIVSSKVEERMYSQLKMDLVVVIEWIKGTHETLNLWASTSPCNLQSIATTY
jgi:hypothetical protein